MAAHPGIQVRLFNPFFGGTRCSRRWMVEGGLLKALLSGSVPLSWANARLICDQPDQEKSGVACGIEHGSIDDHPAARAPGQSC